MCYHVQPINWVWNISTIRTPYFSTANIPHLNNSTTQNAIRLSTTANKALFSSYFKVLPEKNMPKN